MEKILLKKIITLLVIAGIIELFIFSYATFITKYSSTIQSLDEMISQFEVSYENNKNVINDKIDLYKKDYLNRAYAIDFMIANNTSLQTTEGLKKMQHLMDVSAIHLIDHNGIIVLSSDEESVGINLLEHESRNLFWSLIRGKKLNGYEIQLESTTIQKQLKYSFFGIRSTSPDYSVIQIGIDLKVLDSLLSTTTLSYLLENTPTVFEETLLAIDSTSGDLLAITTNNEQDFVVADANSNIERLEILKDLEGGSILEINGSYKFIKTRLVDNIFLVSTKDFSNFFFDSLLQIGIIALTLVLIIVSIIVLLKFYIRKYVLNDVNSISKNIYELNSGNYDISFHASNTPEMNSLSNLLNHWRDSYRYKEERISRIFTSLDSHIAMFECLYPINSNFFSSNIQSVLGISTSEWNDIKDTPAHFEQYIDKLLSIQTEDKLIEINDRILIITPFKSSNEFYGVIIDKTTEINTLRATQYSASMDKLTGLLNRSAFESLIKNRLAKNPNTGILLIFDLDNFKTINDTLGHPEGDKVLQLFADCLRINFRKNDIIARLGGDEFIVFIDSNLPFEMLKAKLDFLLGQIRRQLQFYYDNYNVSTSIGVSYVDNRTFTYTDLYKCADTALYVAKDLGKDQYFFNDENISCMRGKCIKCTKDCKKKQLLFDSQKNQ